MSDIGLRHQADLAGKLTGGAVPACIQIAVEAEVAKTWVAQHLLWMLVNLLARQTPEISELELLIPEGIKPVDRLSPLVLMSSNSGPNIDLRTVLAAAIRSVNPTLEVRFSPCETTKTNSQVFVRVGPGELTGEGNKNFDQTLATTAVGWSGCVSQHPVSIIGTETHPIGAYVAACLCAGEIFKFIRTMRPEAGEFAKTLWLDAYNLEIGDNLPVLTPPALLTSFVGLEAVVAGVGAVANAFLQALYALPTYSGKLTLIDGDAEGVTAHNLNRYVMVGQSQIGQQKASTVANMLKKVGVATQGFDGTWQNWLAKSNENGPKNLDLIISVVDNNEARHAIQNAMPQRILGASTKEMRAQINYFNFHEGGPCLRCRNPLTPSTPDATIIERLKELNHNDLSQLAETAGVQSSTLETFLTNPLAHCGMISGEQLQKFAITLNPQTAQAEWSVGFVSALAGIVLAAEYLKMSLNGGKGALNSEQNGFRFQFWRPEASDTNKIYSSPPQTDCFCQTPLFQQLRQRK